MKLSIKRRGLTVHHYRRTEASTPTVPAWTPEQTAQVTPRPTGPGPAPNPVDVIAGVTVFSEAVRGHRIELLEADSGGFVIVIDGEPVESLSVSACGAAAAFGRYLGAVESRPVLRLLEATNP